MASRDALGEDRVPRRGTAWLGDLARVVVPVQCAGCGALDVALCEPCRAELRSPVERCEAAAPRLDRLDGRAPLPVWARTVYDGPVRELVLAWKDRGRVDLTAVLREEFGAAACELAPSLAVALERANARARVVVVGAPSSRSAVRRRGADLVAGLAEAAASALTAHGVPALAERALEQRRGVRDQVGLGARARGRNLSGRVRVRDGTRLAGRVAVVVDDVLTTGATLAGAVAALERAGARVVGGLVLAATPGPTRTNPDIVDVGPERSIFVPRIEGPTAGGGTGRGIR